MMKFWSLLLLSSLSALLAQENTIIFSDNFDSNSNQWELKKYTDGFETSISNSVLEIKNPTKKTKWLLNTLNVDYDKNFRIVYKLKKIQGPKNNMIFYFNVSDDRKNYQKLNVGEGYWKFERLLQNQWVQSTGWQQTDTTISSNWNTIEITHYNGRLFFQINKKLVFQGSAAFGKGMFFGFGNEGIMTHQVDELSIQYIKTFNLDTILKDSSYLEESVVKTVIDESFNENSNGWLQTRKDNYTTALENGHFTIKNNTDDLDVFTYPKPRFNPSLDFTVTVNATYKSGKVNNLIGFELWKKDRAHRFGFSKNNYRLSNILFNGKRQKETIWTRTSLLYETGYNEIKVEKVRDQLFFSINGNVIEQLNLNTIWNIGSLLKLVASKGITASFDDIEVTQVFLSLKEQDQRITNLSAQIKAALEKEEQGMPALDKKEAQVEAINKQEAIQQATVAAQSYRNSIDKHPFLNPNTTITRISSDGKYTAIYDEKFKHLTIWNLETQQQVHEYRGEDLSKYWAFDWNEETQQPSIVGFTASGYQTYYRYDGKTMQYGNTSLSSNKGYVDSVYEDEVLMVINRFEKDKKGKVDYTKPEWSQVQLYNFITKKWRTYRFEGASNVYISNGFNRAFVYYPKKTEVYQIDLGFKNKKLIKTLPKEGYNQFNIDPLQPHIAFLSFKNKKGDIKIRGAYDMTKDDWVIKSPPGQNNTGFNANNLNTFKPKLIFKDFIAGGKKAQIDIYSDTFENGYKVAFVTAVLEDKAKLILDNLKQETEAKIAQIKAAKAAKNLSQKSDFQQFLINFNELPSIWTLNYDRLQGRDITNVKMTKTYFPYSYNTSVNAIGKLLICNSKHAFLLLLRSNKNGADNSTFAVLETDAYGNKTRYEIIGQTQKALGKFQQAAEISITTSAKKYAVFSVTKYPNGHKREKRYSGQCF